MDQGQRKRKRDRRRKVQRPPLTEGHAQSGADEILTLPTSTLGTAELYHGLQLMITCPLNFRYHTVNSWRTASILEIHHQPVVLNLVALFHICL